MDNLCVSLFFFYFFFYLRHSVPSLSLPLQLLPQHEGAMHIFLPGDWGRRGDIKDKKKKKGADEKMDGSKCCIHTYTIKGWGL